MSATSVATGAVWCVACGGQPDVAITIERRGVLAHYGACFTHIEAVAERVRYDHQPEHEQRQVSRGRHPSTGQPRMVQRYCVCGHNEELHATSTTTGRCWCGCSCFTLDHEGWA